MVSVRAKMCVIGRNVRMISSWWPNAPSAGSAVSTLDEMFSCVSMTPLGMPVVPDV